jgi:hypothetical protein
MVIRWPPTGRLISCGTPTSLVGIPAAAAAVQHAVGRTVLVQRATLVWIKAVEGVNANTSDKKFRL